MTVPTTTGSAIYTGNGVTVTFPYSWQIVAAADLVVYQLSANGLTVTRLTLTTDYTVTGAGVFTGGNVVLVVPTPNLGKLFIASDPAMVQLLLLQQGAVFNPSDYMAALDLLTREVQACRRIANNSIQIPLVESLSGINVTLPPLAGRTTGAIGFNASGNVVLTTSSAVPSGISCLFQGLQFDGTYVIVGRAVKAFTVVTLNRKCTGTATLAVKINGVSVTGLSAVAASSARATATATALNAVAVGDIITLVLSASSVDLADLDITLEILE